MHMYTNYSALWKRITTATFLRSGSVFRNPRKYIFATAFVALVALNILMPLAVTYAQRGTTPPPGPGAAPAAPTTGAPTATQNQSAGSPELDCQGTLAGTACEIFFGILDAVANMFGFFTRLTGELFDICLRFSIDVRGTQGYGSWPLAEIAMAWTLLRDVCNVAFVFMLLYIAILTILDKGNWKSLLTTLIVMAILINFSLLFSEAVIDVGNTLSAAIYNKIVSSQNFQNTQNCGGANQYGCTPSISAFYVYGLQLSTQFNANDLRNMTFNQRFMGYVMQILLENLAIFLFIMGALLFVMRTVILIFVMILSPIAFVAYILPGMRSIWSKWLGALIRETFFAPAYMFTIYITALMIYAKQFHGSSFSRAESDLVTGKVAPGGAVFGIFMHYLIIAGFMYSGLYLARQFGGTSASFAEKWSRKAAGAALSYGVAGAAAVGAYGGQRWRGDVNRRKAEKMDDELTGIGKRYDSMRASGASAAELAKVKKEMSVALAKKATYEKRANRSYDFRNTGVGKAALSGIGGAYGAAGIQTNFGKFAKIGTTSQQQRFAADVKEKVEFGKKLPKEAQELYFQQLEHGGGIIESAYGVSTVGYKSAASQKAAAKLRTPEKVDELRKKYREGEIDPATAAIIFEGERQLRDKYKAGFVDASGATVKGEKKLRQEQQKFEDTNRTLNAEFTELTKELKNLRTELANPKTPKLDAEQASLDAELRNAQTTAQRRIDVATRLAEIQATSLPAARAARKAEITTRIDQIGDAATAGTELHAQQAKIDTNLVLLENKKEEVDKLNQKLKEEVDTLNIKRDEEIEKARKRGEV